MKIQEVSAVDKAATRKKFLLIKKDKVDDKKSKIPDEGGENMSKLEKLLAKIEDEDLKKSVEEFVKNLKEELKKNDDDEGGEGEDFNKSELPEELRKRFEDLEERAAVAEELVKAEREKRLEIEFNKRAKEYANVAEVEKIAGILRKASDIDDEFVDDIENVLKSANERLENADLFKQKGNGGEDVSDVEATIEKKTKELMKSDTSLTFAKAQSKVLRDNPELYKDYIDQK